jgi:hypothetical protein
MIVRCQAITATTTVEMDGRVFEPTNLTFYSLTHCLRDSLDGSLVIELFNIVYELIILHSTPYVNGPFLLMVRRLVECLPFVCAK